MTLRLLPPLVLGLMTFASLANAEERTGAAAMGDWRTDAPGVVRHITSSDLVAPYVTRPSAQPPAVVARPADAGLKTLPGFTVSAFAKLEHPRQIRVAPNGDIFVAESDAGRITVLRAADGAAAPSETSVFVTGLDLPFGLAFWPTGPHPKYLYVAENNVVRRFAYQNGDLKAVDAPQTVVTKIATTTGGHVTRDLDISADGKRVLLSVGSSSNLAEGMPVKSPEDIKTWEADRLPGAAWGRDADRADVLSFAPDGQDRKIFATGIRNCVSLRVNAATGEPWCAVNERDLLGDDLPPDYVTRVKSGGFYGWPWYYIGAHEDPRRKGERPDLAGLVITPDVLIQPHSAPLGLAFYTARNGASAFPAEYRGDAFVSLHGSWNRSKRTGYKIVRIKTKNGVPTGTYEDFLTGFVVDDKGVWGRPVGVAVAHDGALLVADDGSSMIWRVSWSKPAKTAP